jgi:ligand-binding sensor domain-containing protein/signal transduction histidine kinase
LHRWREGEHFAPVNVRFFHRLLAGLCGLVLAARMAGADAGVPSFAVRVWETGDGLPANTIISMTQSRDGHLWLGTLYGLVKFDGIRFTVFDEGNTPGLGDSRIVHLFEDSTGTLWIGTETGGTLMMRHGLVMTPEGLPAGGAERRLIAACEDADGAVWLANANGELWRHKGSRFTPFVLGGPEAGRPVALMRETNGPVWLGTDRRQYAIGEVGAEGSLELPVREELAAGAAKFLIPGRRDGFWRLTGSGIQHWTTNHLDRDYGGYPWPQTIQPTSATEDEDGSLIVGTLGTGVFVISREGRVSSLNTSKGLSHNFVLSLLVDREGTLWVGTDSGGLNRVRRQQFAMMEETRGWAVQSVCVGHDGVIWIASNSDRLGRFKDGAIKRFGFLDLPTRNNSIRTVFVDRAGGAWVGARESGLLRLSNEQFKPVPPEENSPRSDVQAIFQDRAGTMWFGTATELASWNGREWKRFTTADGLTSDHITALAEDARGALWIGTRRGGVNVLRDGKFTAHRKADGLPGDDISCLWVDAQGVVWAGTFGNGLGRFENGRWTRVTVREGLASNNIGFILDDGENLWLGSNSGVMRLLKKALAELAAGTVKSVYCRTYGKAEGLPTFECASGSQPGAWRGADGKLWFATIKGVVSVDPARLRLNTNPPPVTVEAALVDDVAVRPDADATITMRPGDERLEFRYSSLNLGAPELARFRFRLEGYEKDWTPAGNVRVARYSKLSPGRYNFHVTACNEDGVWNETGSTLGVIVQPPFWRTWWFLGAAAVCVFGLTAGIVHYISTQKLQRQLATMRQQEALEKERARIARDIHDQVGASLTQVALLGELVEVDKDLPDEVSGHAKQITQAARETTRALDEIVWTVNPANDTLEGLVNYVCKHAQDYLAVAGLRYRLEFPEPVPALTITPEVRHNVFLASKEAVTNIVRHAKGTSAWLRLRVGPASFTFEIEDNGPGIANPDAPSVRNGLKNMRRRMEDVGGRCEFLRGAEGGLLVRLTVPVAASKVAAT